MEPCRTGSRRKVSRTGNRTRARPRPDRCAKFYSPGDPGMATTERFLILLVATAILLPMRAALCEDSAPRVEAPGASAELEVLMERFAKSGGWRVPFRESRQLTILEDPIESEGVLFFAPPGDLARYTLRPGRSRIVVREDRVLFEDATGSQSFDLASNETARGFVDQFAGLLRGDLLELSRRFTLEFFAEDETWKLVMRPRSRRMRHLVDRIEVEGQGIGLKRMATFDTNGDRTEIFFGESVPLSSLDSSDSKKAFSFDSQEKFP